MIRKLRHSCLAFKLLYRMAVLEVLLASASTEEDDAGSSVPQNNDPVGGIRYKPSRVLIIDDDQGYRHSLAWILTRLYNAQVDDVAGGPEGIGMIKAGGSYDLILIDLFMPEMTGLETYHELREIDPNSQVVFMSVDATSEEWAKAETLEVTLRKPISEVDLIRLLT